MTTPDDPNGGGIQGLKNTLKRPRAARPERQKRAAPAHRSQRKQQADPDQAAPGGQQESTTTDAAVDAAQKTPAAASVNNPEPSAAPAPTTEVTLDPTSGETNPEPRTATTEETSTQTPPKVAEPNGNEHSMPDPDTTTTSGPDTTAPETTPASEEAQTAGRDRAKEDSASSKEDSAGDAGGAPALPVQKVPWEQPEDDTDPDDATAHYVSPTVAKIPAAVMTRFNKARQTAASHTAPVLDAMVAHAHELDQLILQHRPEIAARYAQRRVPVRRLTTEKSTKADLRIRPTEAELGYLKALVNSINVWLEANWPKTKPTDQSEVITVLLDAYLPKPSPSKKAK